MNQKLKQIKVAFLGLGVMGAPMSVNLVKQGYSVTAWNRTPKRPGVELAKDAGANIASNLAQAVTDADIIFTCLGDVADVEEVILGEGVIKYAKANALVVDMSTIGTAAARKIARQLQKQGLRFLDAPISGGDIGAQQGTLTIMVGGKPADFQECEPLLAAMGKNITLCGEVGSGQAVKMCNQTLAAIHMVALCEAIEIARSQGIDPNLMIEVCSTGAAGSWALSNLGTKIVQSDLAPGFMIRHILKDLRLVQEIMPQAPTKLPGVKLAEDLFKQVANLDQGEAKYQGTQAMIRAYLSEISE
ncbi:MAG: NAD(P)-dependent oxidoreductase [Cyanobacteria bacterium J083]|nr:MAG: NAD(P)-dependent oxidoreductase [Cyanobacteria bacterium J083]